MSQRSRFNVGAVMRRPRKQVQAELCIPGDRAKIYFALLRDQKDAVERELGYPVVWEELPARRDCRITVYLENADPDDKSDWSRQHEWLAGRLNGFHRVFALRVRSLDADS